MRYLNLFKGTIKICLWIRYKHDQQSGPPLKNALVELKAKTLYNSETKMIVAPVYTDESGCVSESFELTSTSSALTLIVDLPDVGSIYSGEYYVTSTHNVFLNHTSSIDIDILPEKYFPRLYSCSTCRDASDAHLCTLGWDYEKCCGYDFDTDQCREVESRPFSFGNVCEDCEAVEIDENEGEETDDCSTTDPLCPFHSHRTVRTTPTVIAVAGFILIVILSCYVYRRENTTDATEVTKSAQSGALDEESNRTIEIQKDQQACILENVTPVPLPIAPPKEEYDMIALAIPSTLSKEEYIWL